MVAEFKFINSNPEEREPSRIQEPQGMIPVRRDGEPLHYPGPSWPHDDWENPEIAK